MKWLNYNWLIVLEATLSFFEYYKAKMKMINGLGAKLYFFISFSFNKC
jgi:hypothetical protein